MFAFVLLENADDADDIWLGFIRIEAPVGYFAMIVMQLMEGVNVHVARPDRIDWWRGSVTCMPYTITALVHSSMCRLCRTKPGKSAGLAAQNVYNHIKL
jgi:hypothetical protein